MEVEQKEREKEEEKVDNKKTETRKAKSPVRETGKQRQRTIEQETLATQGSKLKGKGKAKPAGPETPLMDEHDSAATQKVCFATSLRVKDVDEHVAAR